MHIIAHRLEIAVAAGLHYQSLVSSAKEVPELFVPPIVAAGVSSQEPFHSHHQVSPRRFYDEMEVIAHQAIGVHLPLGLFARFGEGLQKSVAVLFI
jgi:hypothetical protein